jgi:hypothetical protein
MVAICSMRGFSAAVRAEPSAPAGIAVATNEAANWRDFAPVQLAKTKEAAN